MGGWDVKYLQQCTFRDCKLNFLGFVEKDMELEKSGADGAKAALLGIYVDRQTDRKINRHSDRQTNIHIDKQTNIHTDKHTYRQTYIQTDRQVDRRTDRQTGKQTDR